MAKNDENDDEKGRNSGFGAMNHEGPWDEFKGEYVVIFPSGVNNSFSGRMVDIKDGEYAILHPYSGVEYDGRGNAVKKVIDRRSQVFLPGSHIEVITKRVF